MKFQFAFIAFISTLYFSAFAQSPSDYLPEKQGHWTFSGFTTDKSSEGLAYAKNLTNVAEWFHKNIPILQNPKGYDLLAQTFGIWDDKYKKMPHNYGWRCEMNFNFELFLKNGRKWTVEPPHYSFYLNNTESGHGSNFNLPGWDNTKDSPSLEEPYEKTAMAINCLFAVFPLIKDFGPGVRLYGDGNLIVFNPDRPAFWLPVTLKELADMYLAYYKLRNKTEMDRLLLKQLELEISELPANELDAPAYSGHETHIVLQANGRKTGLQIMRFNPGYWDRTLPHSAIQFITLYFPEYSPEEAKEFMQNNGFPNYSRILTNSMNPARLADLIMKKE